MSRAGSDRTLRGTPPGAGSRPGTWSSRSGALALALFLLAAPGAAEARGPRRPFLVEGFPTELVIRQEPRPTSPQVGEIPPAARGLYASGRRQRLGRSIWHEVQYRGVRGWVNAPLLAPRRGAPAPQAPLDAGVFVEDLVCLGRSPDWKLVIDRDGSVACTTGCATPELRALPAQPEKGRKGSWRMSIRDLRGNDVMLVSVRYTGQCRDVTGERYAYGVSTLAADGTRQSGCCNRTDQPLTTATP